MGNCAKHERKPEPLIPRIVQKHSLSNCSMHVPMNFRVILGTAKFLRARMETFLEKYIKKKEKNHL